MDESTPTAGGTLRGRRIASTALLVLLTGGLLAVARPGYAQLYPREVHYLPSAHQPPGYVAAAQHMRGGPVAGYMQPVEISVPSGALVSPAQADGFLEPQADKLHVALMVGQLYWFRVGNIPFHEGQEVYPTIEMINRTYPPIGQKLRFPLPVAFTQEDLELALNGNLVTRVIYIEDPRTALPAPQQPGEQRVLDVTSADDPLYVADRMGRPITPLWRTAGWGYVRLHEGAASPRPSYGRSALASWLDRIGDAWDRSGEGDVFVYFNNDPGGAAVRNASAFLRMAQRRGLRSVA